MCAVIFWKVTLMLPMSLILLLEHKNADYVLGEVASGLPNANSGMLSAMLSRRSGCEVHD